MTFKTSIKAVLGILLITVSACMKQNSDTHEKTEEAPVMNQPEKTTTKTGSTPHSKAQSEPPSQSIFKTVEWTDLMPQDDIDALLNPPEYVTEVEDGSLEDQISTQLQNSIALASDDRYQQALSSTRIIQEMDGQAIRIPGFIVPLEFDDDQTITQFFLVPYFGACIHVPPPPPNQIIFVNYPKGFQLDALYDPFWISGTLETTIVENDIATSAYRMQMQAFEPYSE